MRPPFRARAHRRSGGATVDLSAGTAIAPGISAALQGIEGAIGPPFADHLIGNGGDNDFLGLGGDDDIEGGGGFDFVRYDFATKKIRSNLGQGIAHGDGDDVLASMEGFIGGPKDDTASGAGKSNVLVGLKGDDVLKDLGKPDSLFGGPGPSPCSGAGATTNWLEVPAPTLVTSVRAGGARPPADRPWGPGRRLRRLACRGRAATRA